MEGHERSDTAWPEITPLQLHVSSDLLLIVVDHLLTEMVAGFLKLRDRQIINREDAVFDLLVIPCI